MNAAPAIAPALHAWRAARMSARMLTTLLLPVFLATATPAPAAEAPRKAPVTTVHAAQLPRAPLIAAIIALATGIPTVAVSCLGMTVGCLAMGVVTLDVMDWDTGDFNLDESQRSGDTKIVTEQRLFAWSRNTFPFFVVGAGLGALTAAIGGALLVGAFLSGGRE